MTSPPLYPQCGLCGAPYEAHAQGRCPRLPLSAPGRRGGDVSLVLAVLCGVGGAIFLALTLYFGNDASQCNSTLGQFAQGLDSSTAQSCSTVTSVHEITLFATIVLGVGLVIATMVHLFGRRP